MKQLLFLLLAINLYASEFEIKCMAMAIYFESRGSNLADQAAVTDVIMNRVESRKFPNTICEVVKQRHQFSFFWDGKSDRMRNTDAAASAYLLAYQVINYKRFRGITEGSDHYHAIYVKPYWIKSFNLVGKIGKHIYYKSN